MTIRGLRTDRGVVQLVLCPAGAPFPNCGAAGVKRTLTIHDRAATITLADVVPGNYAIAVFHDENGNGRLDTLLGIPREAYGFSNNPNVRYRAPRFSECSFAVSGQVTENIELKHIF